MNIGKINAFNHRTIVLIINCLHFFYLFASTYQLIESSSLYLKKWRGPRRSFLTGEIGVRRRSFPGQMKQQAVSPQVKLRNRRTPVWQMKLVTASVEDCRMILNANTRFGFVVHGTFCHASVIMTVVPWAINTFWREPSVSMTLCSKLLKRSVTVLFQ